MTLRGTSHPRRERRSIRLRGYDYRGQGAYFITICTYRRGTILGDVKNDAVCLNAIGRLVAKSWLDLPRHHRDILLDDWVVMPDHVHGIIALRPDGFAHADDATRAGPGRRSIGSIVGSFKSAVVRRINAWRRTPGPRLWQRGYYERIIRDGAHLERVRRYIRNNPRRWSPPTADYV